MAEAESDVAIVGMACIFPGAGDLQTFWNNICAGVDAISDVPPSGWDPLFYELGSKSVDRIPCRRGGFIDEHARFDAFRHGIMPVAVNSTEPDQLLTLEVATRALEDAGYRREPPRRTGVILGRGAVSGVRCARLTQHIRSAEQLVVALRELVPGLTDADLKAVKEEFQRKNNSGIQAEGVIGLVPNLLASRIASRFDFSGAAYTLDAACASSLIAVDQACLELQCGRADLMLSGGVQLSRDEGFWSVFNQLGALSPTQTIRPFDAAADGLLIGEGIGVLALRRAQDALRDGDRIYAVIRGTGTSSDGNGASLVRPRVEGQLRALEAAWHRVNLDRSAIGLIEAHGTGTPSGDAAETETLHRFFGELGARRVGIGSIKSMIGHTMPAAGAAGLIKAALAVYHGVKPMTLHCETPREDSSHTSFVVQSRTESWDEPQRVAAINAFGFGGINAHVIVANARESRRSLSLLRSQRARSTALPALYAADGIERLCQAITRDERGGEGSARLCLFEPTRDRRDFALRVARRGRPMQRHLGTYFDTRSLLAPGSLAFLFPGFDAEFRPPAPDVLAFFDEPPIVLSETDIIGQLKAIWRTNRFMERALLEFGITPAAVCGHSLGDTSALVAGGVLDRAAADKLIDALKPGSAQTSDAIYVVLGCERSLAERMIAPIEGAVLSHDNCPHQVVICISPSRLPEILSAADHAGVLAQALPFQIGMHTDYYLPSLAAPAAFMHAARFERPCCPVYSATVAAPYPEDEELVRLIAIDHMIKPVRFREVTERMYADGIRVFVQAGSGSLVQFVEDTLRGRPHAAIGASTRKAFGLHELAELLAGLWVQGAEIAWDRLDGIKQPQTTRPARGQPVLLDLSVPFVHFDRPLAPEAEFVTPILGNELSLMQRQFTRNLQLASRAQREVTSALGKSQTPSRRVIRRPIDFERYPELLDHSFQRKPQKWHQLEDPYAVVPLTGILRLMADAVEEMLPGRCAIELTDVTAVRLLGVGHGHDLDIACAYDGQETVEVDVGGYANGTVRVAEHYPTPPALERLRLRSERAYPFTAKELYEDRWMFHGPAYHGVIALDAIGENGAVGGLRCLPALGALLDSGAQVLGSWVMVSLAQDRLTVPMGVGCVRLYGPHPVPGEEFSCDAELESIDDRVVRGHFTLANERGVWARVQSWQIRRVHCDERVWQLMRRPECSLVCDAPELGVAVLQDNYRDVLTRDFLEHCYLRDAEHKLLLQQAPRDRRGWLARRMAAIDAIRHLAWSTGSSHIFPVEVVLRATGAKAFQAKLPDGRVVCAVTDQKGDTTIARASFQPC